MEDFFKQLLAQIVTYLVFVILTLFTFACLMTGEFPPRKESVKVQYQTLLEVKDNAVPVLKMAAEKLQHFKPADPNAITSKPDSNAQDIDEIRKEQAQLKIQLDTLIQQNNEIINLLKKK